MCIVGLLLVLMQVSMSVPAEAAGPDSPRSNKYGTLTVTPNVSGYVVSFVPKIDGTYDFNLHCRNGSWLRDDGSCKALHDRRYSYEFYTRFDSKGGCQGLLKDSQGRVLLESGYTTL